MIRYDLTVDDLNNQIDALDARWRSKAQKRAAAFIKNGAFAEKSSIWSVVKPVFMRLQASKCVFCERQLESPEYGTIEFDLEHFRPKSSVQSWPVAGLHKCSYDFPTGGAGSGYYWLAYDPLNYAASCKTCNSPLKSNYFPIEGKRAGALAPIATLSAERAYLCYPLGAIDTDPEKLVSFVGTTAVPTARSGFNRRRGQVIIDFFELNGREQLHRERARMIVVLGSSLEAIADGSGNETHAKVVAGMDAAHVPHSACLRAFHRLWRNNQPFARRMLDQCRSYSVGAIGAPLPRT